MLKTLSPAAFHLTQSRSPYYVRTHHYVIPPVYPIYSPISAIILSLINFVPATLTSLMFLKHPKGHSCLKDFGLAVVPLARNAVPFHIHVALSSFSSSLTYIQHILGTFPKGWG